ncbi:MAG: flagellar assembly protein FliW [Fimbriimonadaceae bacterium]
MTLNLAGPILVNIETRRARQVVLDTDEWAVKHPAFRQDQRAAA